MMYDINIYRKREIYDNYLHKIQGVQFTYREIDIMTCILHNRGDKKIASLLSLSHRTIGSHVRNITSKIAVSSREGIIDFMEKSGKADYFREYYAQIFADSLFKNQLKKIATLLRGKKVKYFSEHQHINSNKKAKHLVDYLELANIFFENSDKEVKYNLHFITQHSIETDVSSVKTINLLFNKNINIDLIKTEYIDFRVSNDYYFSVFKLIEQIIDKPELQKIVQEFKNDYNKIKHFPSNDLPTNTKTLQKQSYRKITLLIISVIFLLVLAIVRVTSRDKTPDIEEFNREIAKLAYEISSDNVSNFKKHQQNFSKVSVLDNIISAFKHDKIEQYFTSPNVPINELLNMIYIMQTAASYGNYIEHDGSGSRQLLNKAKFLAEQYMVNKSRIKIDFSELDSSDIYNEMIVLDDMVELYARIIYTLGVTYFYQGDLDDSLKYFTLAEYLGDKANIFEHHLSIRSRAEAVRRTIVENHIRNNNYAEAESLLHSGILLLEELRESNREYIKDYKPRTAAQDKIIPINDNYNKCLCNERLIKSYLTLILITEDNKKQTKYIKHIKRLFLDNDGLLDLTDKVLNKKGATIYNLLAQSLFVLYKQNLDFAELQRAITKRLDLKEQESLNIILQIYELAKSKSKSNDYTKADYYNGIIGVYDYKLKHKINTKDNKQIQKKITELRIKLEETNKKLNRTNPNFPF
jgi:DNA-binding CsgD family transcriptional regulator